MKLSNLSTDAALDVLVEMTPFVNAILSDKELRDELKSKVVKEKEGETKKTSGELIALGVERINSLVPILLKKHRMDVYGILGALNGKSADEIAEQNIIKTSLQIKELLSDKEVVDFFKSFGDTDKNQ